jgi:hypothetical protein
MDLFSDFIQAVQDDLTIDNDSPLFPLALVKRAINRAYNKAGGLFRWPETEDAKKTSTQENIEYYDYPEDWRPDSIWKLTVDDVDYGDPIAFKDYLYEKENDIPSGLQKMWANQWRRYFIYPTPTSAGDYNISVWGQKVVEEMEDDNDETIFSYSMPECNEAIVLEAVAILKSKGEEEKSSTFRSTEAKNILALAWKRIKEEQAKIEKTTPFLDVPDYFGRGTKLKSDVERIGNF